MPGCILYNRRWSVGSDDLLLPALFLLLYHFVWLFVIIVVLSSVSLDRTDDCQEMYFEHLIGYIIIFTLSLLLEIASVFIASRGTVFDSKPREGMQYLIYIKQGLMLVELCWVGVGLYWIQRFYVDPPCQLSYTHKNIVLALVICNLSCFFILMLVVWCSWDYAGRSWLKLKKYQQRAMQTSGKSVSRVTGLHRSREGTSRNWRHRKVRRAYQSSWDSRCRMLFCCSKGNRKSKSSFADIAQLLSEFFRDLDVVPTDVLVGLVLLRQKQQQARRRIVRQASNNVYDFLSGVKVTPETKFVALDDASELQTLRDTVHYMYFALAAYGWPMYLLHNKTVPLPQAACKLCTSIRCCCIPCCKHNLAPDSVVLEDNCCMCNYSALKQVCHLDSTEIVYATYHVDVGETPFFIGVDFDRKTIVVSIRGTLSMKDIITDLNAESEILPLEPVNEEWKGHKGMVQAATYIYRILIQQNLLDKAFTWSPERGTNDFPVVCVGHSLGGGTAAILSLLLRSRYPTIRCYAFSPPGGLLSQEAMEASREFIISVVVGKDVVPRLGLNQLENLRHDLIDVIKQSDQNKWATLSCSLMCSRSGGFDSDLEEAPEEHQTPTQAPVKQQSPNNNGLSVPTSGVESRHTAINVHPLDSSINLSVHQPMYPPGKIVHIVRHHPDNHRSKDAVYQAVWADNKDFDQVLISKCMVQDHMPDNVLDALEKASCIHAWHSVYTSRTVCGPTPTAPGSSPPAGGSSSPSGQGTVASHFASGPEPNFHSVIIEKQPTGSALLTSSHANNNNCNMTNGTGNACMSAATSPHQDGRQLTTTGIEPGQPQERRSSLQPVAVSHTIKNGVLNVGSHAKANKSSPGTQVEPTQNCDNAKKESQQSPSCEHGSDQEKTGCRSPSSPSLPPQLQLKMEQISKQSRKNNREFFAAVSSLGQNEEEFYIRAPLASPDAISETSSKSYRASSIGETDALISSDSRCGSAQLSPVCIPHNKDVDRPSQVRNVPIEVETSQSDTGSLREKGKHVQFQTSMSQGQTSVSQVHVCVSASGTNNQSILKGSRQKQCIKQAEITSTEIWTKTEKHKEIFSFYDLPHDEATTV